MGPMRCAFIFVILVVSSCSSSSSTEDVSSSPLSKGSSHSFGSGQGNQKTPPALFKTPTKVATKQTVKTADDTTSGGNKLTNKTGQSAGVTTRPVAAQQVESSSGPVAKDPVAKTDNSKPSRKKPAHTIPQKVTSKVASKKTASDPVAKAAPSVDLEQAKRVFSSRCAICHGSGGRGDGPAAANLQPKPRDYTSASWQSSVTDKRIYDVIAKGGVAMGMSAIMPANPDLKKKPEVLHGLVQLIRSFKR